MRRSRRLNPGRYRAARSPDDPILRGWLVTSMLAAEPEALRAHRITVYRLIDKGTLHAFKVGRGWRLK
jgi:hypothetical protein